MGHYASEINLETPEEIKARIELGKHQRDILETNILNIISTGGYDSDQISMSGLITILADIIDNNHYKYRK